MFFLKIMMAVAGLAAIAIGLSFLVPYFRPIPALAVGIYSGEPNGKAAGAELTRRLLQRFPKGSSSAALQAELKRQGWGPIMTDNITKSDLPWQYVRFKRPINLLMVEVSTVVWKSDKDGRLTDVYGGYFRDAFFKQGGWS
jgi:hypothetical protein